MDGARTALRDPASVLGAGEADLLADDPQQRSLRIAVEIALRAVDVERDGHVKLLCGSSGCGTSGAGFDPCGDQRPELRLRAWRRFAIAARFPSPAHQ